ncbi:MAG: C39 family peptidase [Patescibacteria group bacterium]
MSGRPIIVPVFAPALWDKNFRGDGPDYHVMVLIGYDDSKGVFIVNDPGTANGNGRHFTYEKFLGAIHDLNNKNYQAGQKAVLFTEMSNWNEWKYFQ